MGNKIIDSTNEALKTLANASPEAYKAYEQMASEWTTDRFPVSLSPEDGLNLAKAVKYICSVDGLSSAEKNGLRLLMGFAHFPQALIDHVESFDCSEVTITEVSEVFPSGSLRAKILLDTAINVAVMDGFSTTEREAMIKMAAHLGLRREIVEAYEARIRLGSLIIDNPDPAIQAARLALRRTMWALS